jgi:LPXTG-motif cell wall-anchored protein
MVIREDMGLEQFALYSLGEAGEAEGLGKKSFFKKLKKLSPLRMLSKMHRKINPLHRLIRPQKKKHSGGGASVAVDETLNPAPEPYYDPSGPSGGGGGSKGGGSAPDSYPEASEEEGAPEEGEEGEEGGQAPAADTGPTPKKKGSPTLAPTEMTGSNWTLWVGGAVAIAIGGYIYWKKRKAKA